MATRTPYSIVGAPGNAGNEQRVENGAYWGQFAWDATAGYEWRNLPGALGNILSAAINSILEEGDVAEVLAQPGGAWSGGPPPTYSLPFDGALYVCVYKGTGAGDAVWREAVTYGNSGAIVVDFGAFPGGTDASVAVTGQSRITTANVPDAWIRAVATVDHSADEHRVEPLQVTVGPVTAGVGFTIFVSSLTQLDYGQWSIGWSW